MTKQQIAEMVKTSAEEYLAKQTEHSWQKLASFATLVSGKILLDSEPNKAIHEILREQAETDRIQERLNSKS